MNNGYLGFLAQISVEIIAIIMAFYGGYRLYLRDRKDRYRDDIVFDLKALDNYMRNFPITHLFFERKETWKEYPREILEEPFNKITQAFSTAEDEERGPADQVVRHRQSVFYSPVKFLLIEFINIIRNEFPTPPGDHIVEPESYDDKFIIESYVSSNFPKCEPKFLKWAERLELFHYQVMRYYKRNLNKIISTLKMLNGDSSKHSEDNNWFERLPKITEDKFREWQEYSLAEYDYYHSVFTHLNDINNDVNMLCDKIASYNKYGYKRANRTNISIIIMIVTGVLLPFIWESTQIVRTNIQIPQIHIFWLNILTTFFFILSTFVCIYTIYSEIIHT